MAIVLGACTASEKIDGVESEVAKFHALLDEGRFETIWYQGSTEFQKVVSREEFVLIDGRQPTTSRHARMIASREAAGRRSAMAFANAAPEKGIRALKPASTAGRRCPPSRPVTKPG